MMIETCVGYDDNNLCYFLFFLLIILLCTLVYFSFHSPTILSLLIHLCIWLFIRHLFICLFIYLLSFFMYLFTYLLVRLSKC